MDCLLSVQAACKYKLSSALLLHLCILIVNRGIRILSVNDVSASVFGFTNCARDAHVQTS